MQTADIMQAALEARNINAHVDYQPHVKAVNVRIHPANHDYLSTNVSAPLFEINVPVGSNNASYVETAVSAINHYNAEAAQ